ncbi:hypothetical protein PR048_011370 [Dryococelus australis]|uniref:Uncharacterized protein n=1 Tax=Dryococelus australis TaxID=614101 RepID=A0ABQ9HLZ1_9NEOP|nr:hypothetical protein PR048_011370 [Dryococelus australis]
MDQIQKCTTPKQYKVSKGILHCKHHFVNEHKIDLPQTLCDIVFQYFHSSPVELIWLCSLSKPMQDNKLGLLSSDFVERPLHKTSIDFLAYSPALNEGLTSCWCE